MEEWKRSGGANQAYLKTFHRGRLMMCLHYREAVGSGGFQAGVGYYSMNATRATASTAAPKPPPGIGSPSLRPGLAWLS